MGGGRFRFRLYKRLLSFEGENGRWIVRQGGVLL